MGSVCDAKIVSTHSRSKAAAPPLRRTYRPLQRFNSQPLEGGCKVRCKGRCGRGVSTHSRSKAAASNIAVDKDSIRVSTHSRSKAAAGQTERGKQFEDVSTHSRSKAAAPPRLYLGHNHPVSTHSRSKAAAAWVSPSTPCCASHNHPVSTHSRSKAAASSAALMYCPPWFQLTAARRRLRPTRCSSLLMWVPGFNSQPLEGGCVNQRIEPVVRRVVSTHSRSKAAARLRPTGTSPCQVSTHSRSKAAAKDGEIYAFRHDVSTHSRSKAAARQRRRCHCHHQFQLTAARRRLRQGVLTIQLKWPVSTHSRSKAAA